MSRDNLPVCTACGMLYDTRDRKPPSNCKICDDPRQFVPASGQSWTTLQEMRSKHHNNFEALDGTDEKIWQIYSEPRVPIGQRAHLIITSEGNVLWDMIALLDQATVDFIKSKGGLKAIVISHPHYYTTYALWAETFDCKIYLSSDDVEWVGHKLYRSGLLEIVDGRVGTTQTILSGLTAIKIGGHFPGQLVLHWSEGQGRLFIADGIVTVPSGYTPHPRPPGQSTYSFLWSIPNMIPMPPGDVLAIWNSVKDFGWQHTHGAFQGMDLHGDDLKKRLLESMQIQVRTGGWTDHELLSLRLE